MCTTPSSLCRRWRETKFSMSSLDCMLPSLLHKLPPQSLKNECSPTICNEFNTTRTICPHKNQRLRSRRRMPRGLHSNKHLRRWCWSHSGQGNYPSVMCGVSTRNSNRKCSTCELGERWRNLNLGEGGEEQTPCWMLGRPFRLIRKPFI